MYSGCTLKLAKLRVFKGFLHLRLPASLRKSTLGDLGVGAVGVALAPLGFSRRVVAPSRHPAPRSRQGRSRPAEQGRHRARLGARRRVISINTYSKYSYVFCNITYEPKIRTISEALDLVSSMNFNIRLS